MQPDGFVPDSQADAHTLVVHDRCASSVVAQQTAADEQHKLSYMSTYVDTMSYSVHRSGKAYDDEEM